MAKVRRRTAAVVGGDSLLGREIRDIFARTVLPADLRLIAGEEAEAVTLTEQEGEPAVVRPLDALALNDADVVFLAGSQESSRKALELASGPVLIDLTYASDERENVRLRAPVMEPPGLPIPAGAIHMVAHPAAIAVALTLARLHGRYPVVRSVMHVFEPASERGSQGIKELQQQTINLLSFKSVPKGLFDAQLSFNMLARYGEEAPLALEDVEARIDRHVASLLALSSHAPPPSLRLIQAPVFHGYSISAWVELEQKIDVAALERALQSDAIEVWKAAEDPPTNVGVAGQHEILVGAVTPDRNNPQAFWFWMVLDNVRLPAENGVAVAHEFLTDRT
ncbi:MAG: Asd/ArgC dimerization domain-containing protein [Bryobacteraceae bacterium]